MLFPRTEKPDGQGKTPRRLVSACVLASMLLTSGALAGCQAELQAVLTHEKVEQYYNQKYALHERVTSSDKGDGLTHYPPKSEDVRFFMSDGSCVVYDGNDGAFHDDHQTRELNGLASRYISDIVDKLPDAALSPELAEVRGEFHVRTQCWDVTYHGSIRECLEEQRPTIFFHNVKVATDVDDVRTDWLCAVYQTEDYDEVMQCFKELVKLGDFNIAFYFVTGENDLLLEHETVHVSMEPTEDEPPNTIHAGNIQKLVEIEVKDGKLDVKETSI